MKRFYKLSILAAALFLGLCLSLFTDTTAYAETSAESGGFSCTEVIEIPTAECQALVSLFYSTDGPNWSRNSGWLHDYTPCDWQGIRCHDNHITVLRIESNYGMNGTIPVEIGNLSHLTELYLFNSSLSGSIPKEIGKLSNLTILNLGSNDLSGAIPSELGDLSNLTLLDLYSNQLSGEIPIKLGNLVSLTDLSLYTNQLIGSIPTEFEKLSNLRTLHLGSNQLSGAIPPELSNLSNLRTLMLFDNQLSGIIPPDLGGLSNLTHLYFHENQLSGPIPIQLGDLEELQFLLFYKNQLSGPIPNELGQLKNLIYLLFDNNQLSGSVPSEIGGLPQLTWLSLNNNQLSGSMPEEFVQLNLSKLSFQDTHICLPDTLTTWFNSIPQRVGTGITCSPDYAICQNITEIPRTECEALIDLYHGTDGPNWTDLSGWLVTNQPCSWFGVTCAGGSVTRLQFMELSTETGNGLKGVLPASIVQLNNLTHLLLDFNDINMIPPYIGGLKKLQWLTMTDNGLQSVPSEIGELESLVGLALSYNHLNTLPSEIGNLTTLTHLNLVNNQLERLPSEIGRLVNVTKLYLDNNHLYMLPIEIGQMEKLEGLRVPNNPIVELPATIGDLDNLLYMVFEHNSLQSLPPEIGQLESIQYINVANNYLETLPVEIADLSTLHQFDIRSNRLSTIPEAILRMDSLRLFYPAYNRIATTNPELVAILDSLDHDWRDTQTVTPTDLTATWISQDSVQLTWTPIPFQDKGGYYEIKIFAIPADGGGYVLIRHTTDKNVNSYIETGMTSSTSYAFEIRTHTPTHDGEENGQTNTGPDQRNELWSEFSEKVSPVFTAAEPKIYVSTARNGRVDNVRFADEDIVVYDPNTDSWARYFDGSDVGLRRVDINAFHLLENGNILMSFNRPVTLDGVGYDDSDILVFVPTRLGNRTRGSFRMYLDGSDVRLTRGGEDIDAIGFAPNGDLVISTLGNGNVGFGFRDDDLIRLTNATMGDNSSGTWQHYLDGSDIGLTTGAEDISAVWIDQQSEGIHLNTLGNFNINSLGTTMGGDREDIVICSLVPNSQGDTDCLFDRFWDGDDHRFNGKRIDGYSVQPYSSRRAGAIFSTDGDIDDNEADNEPDIWDTQDDDVLDEEDIKSRVYLPIVNQ